ncbi:MAG: hypothetical protein LBH57_01435 [Treponema sp.]|jgi:hypothetical protein|nr:hypothetical protein [Treponema sp.]
MKFLPAALVSAALVFCGCHKEQVLSVTREDLFSLDIGRMEDQIDLFNLEGSRSVQKTSLAMRDGLFYISNGNGGKIVRYTSFGDLLFMIYNEETNPPPLSLRPLGNHDGVVTRWALTYPLLSPGAIAVDSRKHIYAEDRLPYERHGFDRENKALLDSMILHFDADGRFVEYLGQEGPGGTPFPRISGIFAAAGDELAVVCRLPQGWSIYWFDGEGAPLYRIPLSDKAVPIPGDRSEVFPSVDAIAAAPDARRLFIKVDYYRNTYDESTNTRSGNEGDGSVIWIMNVEDGSYTGAIEVPFFEYTAVVNNRQVTENLLYSMLGVIKNNRVFLSFPVEGGYSILILSADSREQRRGFIRVDDEELRFNAFNLSEDGILSGLLATDWEAKIVWWRTDRLVGELAP